MGLEKITAPEQLNDLLTQENKLLILKNSTTCPISHKAFEEFSKFSDEVSFPIYYLNVQEARSVSNEIADKFSLKHESPQVILFENGKMTWHASHWSITYKALKEALDE